MSKIKYSVIVIVSIGLGILIGFFVKPNPLATIVISNSSSKVVRAVYIVVGMTTYVVEDIEQRKSKNVNVFVAGEAGYAIKVRFANGDTLVNWNYIETSNKINETISDSNIVSTFAQH